jgi:hypothetical protein
MRRVQAMANTPSLKASSLEVGIGILEIPA